MPELTNTTELTSIGYTLPSLRHDITVHLPSSPTVAALVSPASTHRVMQIPVGSRWEPGAQWHEDHVEHVRVLRGAAKAWVNGTMRLLGAGDEAVFRLLDVHNFCRADFDHGEDLLIEEWTDNEDGSKVVFFRNAFSIVRDVDKFGGLLRAFLRFFYLCSYRDNYISFCPAWTPRWVQRAVTGAVFGAVRGIGKTAGWPSWYSEYTPRELWEVAEEADGKKRV